MTQEDDEHYRNNNNCRFCEKNFEPDKARDHCHLTGKIGGPAHSTCNINVTEKQRTFIPFLFHNFSHYDGYLFFENYSIRKVIKSNLKLYLI